MNNEVLGVSCEIAIADVFNIPVDDEYRNRGNIEIEKSLYNIIEDEFKKLPKPKKLISAKQNPVDFILQKDCTLSVKSNKNSLGKVAPQRVGQASSNTFFSFFKEVYGEDIPENYNEKVKLFKESVYKYIDILIPIYWENLFDTDYLIYFYNVLNKDNTITNNPKVSIYRKNLCKNLDLNKFSFTKRNHSAWNESNTVKYCNISIGEFQVHNNRDNFKFRFNMKGLNKLIENDLIEIDIQK